MVMSVGINMSSQEVRRYCATSIDVIVQLGREDGRRDIAQVFLPDSMGPSETKVDYTTMERSAARDEADLCRCG